MDGFSDGTPHHLDRNAMESGEIFVFLQVLQRDAYYDGRLIMMTNGTSYYNSDISSRMFVLVVFLPLFNKA